MLCKFPSFQLAARELLYEDKSRSRSAFAAPGLACCRSCCGLVKVNTSEIAHSSRALVHEEPLLALIGRSCLQIGFYRHWVLVPSLVESNDGRVHQSVGYLAEIAFLPVFKYLLLNTKEQKALSNQTSWTLLLQLSCTHSLIFKSNESPPCQARAGSSPPDEIKTPATFQCRAKTLLCPHSIFLWAVFVLKLPSNPKAASR